MIEDVFNVMMVWDKLIFDVEHQYGELFTRMTEDTLIIRVDISNIYHNIKKKEHMKDESNPTSIEFGTISFQIVSFSTKIKISCKTYHSL